MLRVLQVVTHMNRGGLETMLMNYYRQIDRGQVQFDFLTHRPYDGDYGEEIKALGGCIYHLPVLNPFSASYRKAVGSFFDEHPEYQILHVHQDCLSSVMLSIAKRHGIKVRIAHSHAASQDKDFKYPIKLFFRRFIAKYATDLMACSKDAGDWMFCGAQFTVLNNAINAQEYRFNPEIRQEVRKELKCKENELLVGHVGRFSPPKNHQFLIEIFRALNSKTKARLLLVGEGELVPLIKELVESYGVTDRVVFAGLRTDVSRLLQAMDVFVFPSNYEGLPLSIIEAQAAGLPCLISDKVPIECKKTDLVQQIPLSAGTELWADKAISAAHTEREDTYEDIKSSGFDVVSNANWLQDYYLQAAER